MAPYSKCKKHSQTYHKALKIRLGMLFEYDTIQLDLIMKNFKIFRYFSAGELLLWSLSVLIILICYVCFSMSGTLSLIASLIGVTSLILCAKGNPLGQVLIIIFSLLYAVISYDAKYYGEMITYLGMTAPMATVALIAWIRNPYKGNKSEVAIGRVTKRSIISLIALTIGVTILFYFILKALGTARLIPSTLSIATSFVAAYLTYLRVPSFALAYAANDVVLITMWLLAASYDPSAISTVVCFCTFLLNDIYGYVSWKRMKRRQEASID